jgi:hypothetical protein
MAGETKINGMGLLHDIRQQWGLLGTRQKKLNANEMNRKKVMAFLKKCTCTYFKVRRGTKNTQYALSSLDFFTSHSCLINKRQTLCNYCGVQTKTLVT